MSTCITSFDPICLQSGSAPLPAPLSKGISWSSTCWVREGILTQGYVSERKLKKQTKNFTKIFRWIRLNELFMKNKNNTAVREWLNECISISWKCNEVIVIGWFYVRKCHSQPMLKPPIDTLCLKECPVILPRSFYPSISPVLDPTLPKAHPHEFTLLIHAFLSRMQHQTLNSQPPRTEWRKNRNAQASLALSPAQNPCIAYASHRHNSGGCVCVCMSALEEGATRSNIYPATFST